MAASSRASRDLAKSSFSCSNFPQCDVIANALEDLPAKYATHVKTAYVKKSRFQKKGKKEPAAKKASSSKKTSAKKSAPKQKLLKLSPELAAVLREKELTRPETIKKLWDYIKSHKLQDPKNKRLIKPDAKLAKVFNSKNAVDMMKLSGIINQHLKA